VVPEEQGFSAYFGTIAQIEDAGERFSIPMRPEQTKRYECLSRPTEEVDEFIRREWSNGGYASTKRISVMPSHQSRRATTKKATPTIVTFDDHASYTDAPRRPILLDLRNRVLRLDDRLRRTEQCTGKQRIAYNIPGGRIFLEVKVQRAAIVLHLADGGCPDPNGIAGDIAETHGWHQLKKRITILNMADLDAAMPFVEAAYRARP
jgi:predicted transport protein